MDGLKSAYDSRAFFFWLALAVLVLLAAFWLMMLQRRVSRIDARLERIFQNLQGDDVAGRLVEYLATVRQTAAEMQRVRRQHEQLMKAVPSAIRHVGLVRFSPFHDTGGDQSFTLALLDGRGDGVVVTGLHSRTDSRLYAKPVERGESSYALTPEEREAMEVALRGREGEQVER